MPNEIAPAVPTAGPYVEACKRLYREATFEAVDGRRYTSACGGDRYLRMVELNNEMVEAAATMRQRRKG